VNTTRLNSESENISEEVKDVFVIIGLVFWRAFGALQIFNSQESTFLELDGNNELIELKEEIATLRSDFIRNQDVLNQQVMDMNNNFIVVT
jgi:hypothetical protein